MNAIHLFNTIEEKGGNPYVIIDMLKILATIPDIVEQATLTCDEIFKECGLKKQNLKKDIDKVLSVTSKYVSNFDNISCKTSDKASEQYGDLADEIFEAINTIVINDRLNNSNK